MPRPSSLAPLALLAALPAARADFQLSAVFASAGCAGAPTQNIASFLGCAKGPGGTLSYSVRCLNASAFNVTYFSGATCAGPAVQTVPVAMPAGCVAEPGGQSWQRSSCEDGSFAPPAASVNQYLYGPPNECPVQSGDSLVAVSSLTEACHANPGPSGPKGYKYGCDARNVTFVYFSTADCSGSPLGPAMPVMPLGCAVSLAPNGGPSFTACGSKPPHAAAAALLRGAAGGMEPVQGGGSAAALPAPAIAVAAAPQRAAQLEASALRERSERAARAAGL